jgi:hypothetical protein
LRSAWRETLVGLLLDEMKHGSSVIQLYAGLLARSLVEEEPNLRRYSSSSLLDVPECD